MPAGYHGRRRHQSKDERDIDNPDCYLCYNNRFNRMGGQMRYVMADNRDFLLALLKSLEG